MRLIIHNYEGNKIEIECILFEPADKLIDNAHTSKKEKLSAHNVL